MHKFTAALRNRGICQKIAGGWQNRGNRGFGDFETLVIKHTTVLSMRSERGLSTILHCLQWYKLVLRTRLPTPAVQYLPTTRVVP